MQFSLWSVLAVLLALSGAVSGTFYTGMRYERAQANNKKLTAENAAVINFIEGQRALNDEMAEAMGALADDPDVGDPLPAPISRVIDRMPAPVRKPSAR